MVPSDTTTTTAHLTTLYPGQPWWASARKALAPDCYLFAVFISDVPFCYYWYYRGFDNTTTVTAHLTTLYLWQFWWDSARKALRLMYVYIMFDDNNGCCLPSVLKGWCPAVTGDSKTRCITFLETEECWQSCCSFTTSIHWGEVVSFGGRQESEQNCQYEEWQCSEAEI